MQRGYKIIRDEELVVGRAIVVNAVSSVTKKYDEWLHSLTVVIQERLSTTFCFGRVV